MALVSVLTAPFAIGFCSPISKSAPCARRPLGSLRGCEQLGSVLGSLPQLCAAALLTKEAACGDSWQSHISVAGCFVLYSDSPSNGSGTVNFAL